MTNRTPVSTVRNETGIALVLSLFLMAAISVVAASLMFLAQTETYSSMNYRMMSQARYGAESGIQKATNYLLNNYTAPSNPGSGADVLANYDTRKSPVTCLVGCPNINGPVVLSANAAVASNYPVAAVQAAFLLALQGNLPSGATTVAYAPSAKLLSMQQVQVYGGGMQTIQTWEVTADGSITTGKTATVQVSAILETQKLPATMYAAFGTNGGCGALDFKGNTTYTDSYNSQAPGFNPANPVSATNGGESASGGNVGTNGNLTEAGGATINGTLSTPRVGVGSCSSGNVDALSSSGGATVNGGGTGCTQPCIDTLPQQVVMPTPLPPTPMPPISTFSGNGQTLLNGAIEGNVTVDAHSTLTLGAPSCTSSSPCYITMNSLTLNGNATLNIQGTVILNIGGKDASGNWITPAVDFTGGAVSNATMDPSKFQIEYAGTGEIKLNGGSQNAEMIYAPNAPVSFNGGGSFYGSVVAATVVDNGGASIHFDRSLTGKFFVIGNPLSTASFSWKKY